MNGARRIAVVSTVVMLGLMLVTGLSLVSCENPSGPRDSDDPSDPGGTDGPDTESPTIAITSPANGETVPPTFTMKGTASDNNAVTRVHVSIDGGAQHAASGTSSWSFAVPPVTTSGSHSISVTAEDEAGNLSDAASITVIVTSGWYSMGQVTDTPASDLSISSDNERLVVFYRYPNTSLNLDEGIIKEWNGRSWSTMYHATNQCHNPDIAVEGNLISATWHTDGYDAMIGTNANGPFVTMGMGGLGHEYGMTAAVAKGRAYVTYVCKESDDTLTWWSMLHVKSPIGTTGTRKELNGGWKVIYENVHHDPAITGNSSHWYVAFVQAGFMYLYRDGYDYGSGFRFNNTPLDPELALYEDNLAIAWLEYGDGYQTIYVASSDGEDLPTPLEYAKTTTDFFGSLRIAAYGPNLYLSYVEASAPPTLYVDRYDGTNWSNLLTRSLPGAAGTVPAADIAVYDEKPVVGYIEDKTAHVLGYLP